MLVAVCLLVVAGCELETRIVKDGWGDFPADPPVEAHADDPSRPTWGVLLEQFSGEERHQQAQGLIDRLRRQAAVIDAWAVDEPGVTSVYRGRFTDPSTDAARELLARTRRIQLGDETPFAHAMLSSPATRGGEGPVRDRLDLRQYPGYHSLLVGFYDDAYDGDRREAAERRAHELREQEHEAYYYHGPNQSMVTVGLFSYDEAFVAVDNPRAAATQVDAYSDRVRHLQETFPHNQANGETLMVEDEQGAEREQASMIVRVN